MPTYEYICPECKHIQEIEHSINFFAPYLCFNCLNEGKSRRLTKGPGGGIATHFKGTGWTT